MRPRGGRPSPRLQPTRRRSSLPATPSHAVRPTMLDPWACSQTCQISARSTLCRPCRFHRATGQTDFKDETGAGATARGMSVGRWGHTAERELSTACAIGSIGLEVLRRTGTTGLRDGNPVNPGSLIASRTVTVQERTAFGSTLARAPNL
jgi:hypothetical protein